jgi:Pyruvate/2-oxoacid:ferredoxin oxidoreductase delta subunit
MSIITKKKTVVYPVIDFSRCVKCEKCIAVCPHKVIHRENLMTCSKCIKYCITMDVPCKSNDYFFEYDLCDACGKCIEVCTHEAITMKELIINI